jgi:hypothetical protein
VPLLLQLERHPELWNQHNDRTTRAETAHSATSDIWLRYRPLDQLTSPASYNEPFHDMTWYPAYFQLPEIRPITQFLMNRVSGTSLGGCLITRIAGGGQVLPHSDAKSWHARHFQTKLYIPLKANPQCINRVEDEELVMKTGEIWYFDNLKEHAVVNAGNSDRMTLIVSIRCD